MFDKQPNYEFNISTLGEITHLLKPFTNIVETNLFMTEVDQMYQLRTEFCISLIKKGLRKLSIT